MDATNDLIISVAKGPYTWSDFVPFVASLEDAGFCGTKVMCVDSILPEVRDSLIAHGYLLIDFVSEEPPTVGDAGPAEIRWRAWMAFGRTRLIPILTFLEENVSRFRYILCPDWKDLIFQTNPFVWLENNLSPHKLLGCSEIVKIKDQVTMREWVQHIVDEHDFSWLGEQDICCCGTLVGEAQEVHKLMCRIYSNLSPTDLLRTDQGELNFLLRVDPFKSITRVPKYAEGFAATVGWIKGTDYDQHKDHFTDAIPDFDESTGLVYPQGQKVPFSIVHQYDRSDSWTSLVNKRYGRQTHARTSEACEEASASDAL